MSLQSIIATTHPLGNRVDLDWQPDPDVVYDGVRIVRKEGSYPNHFDDGVFVAQITSEETSAIDDKLKADRHYYYMLFPYVGTIPVYDINTQNRVSAFASANNGYSEFLYQQLPEIYRRYDKDAESLKQFLAIPGSHLDQLQSYARSILDLKSPDRVHANLLPVLGQWLGWKTDFKGEVNVQREEIKNAPALFKATGLIPTVEATVKRISAWENKTKEYMHNIFSSNRPEELNLWLLSRANDGTWQTESQLISMDANVEGNSCYAIDSNNIRWVIYHTQRAGQWEIWNKTSPVYHLSKKLLPEMVAGVISTNLFDALKELDIDITQTATINIISSRSWEMLDGIDRYVFEDRLSNFSLLHESSNTTHFAESEPLVIKKNHHLKYPTAIAQSDELWIFYSQFEQTTKRWSIGYQSRQDSRWSISGPAEPDPLLDIARNPFAVGGIYDPLPQRRFPCVALDDSQRLWLFWIENSGNGWQLKYNRREAGLWGTTVTMPLDAGDDPRVVKDVQLLIRTGGVLPLIYVFWSRPAGISIAGVERWEIVYRVKEDLNLDDFNWTGVQSLPKDVVSDNHHDREPFAIVINNQLEVFFSSNREQTGWAIWHSRLTDYATNTWDPITLITSQNYSSLSSLVTLDNGGTRLFYRSNRHIVYSSDAYRSTETNDLRYSGSQTVDVRNRKKINQWNDYADYQTYTYDSGTNNERTDLNRIARDTIGIFVDTQSYNVEELQAGIDRLRPVVAEFMPMTDRAVFVTDSISHDEYVYTYNLPISSSAHFINSSYRDLFNGEFVATVLSDGEDFLDNVG